MGTLVQLLHEVRLRDRASVGGKAASLGELLARGFEVPPGFVLSTAAFRAALSVAVQHEIVRPPSSRSLAARLAARIKKCAFSTELEGEFEHALRAQRRGVFAVRSSATVEDGAARSWAGQFHTELAVAPAALAAAVKECWASTFADRVMEYRKSGAADGNIDVAVVVQAMVPSRSAGIAFSAHPVTRDATQIVVEAVYGIGECAVSGRVSPETWVIDKSRLRTVQYTPHRQRAVQQIGRSGLAVVPLKAAYRSRPVLAAKELERIGALVRRLERSFKYPVDVEWALEGDALHVLQCRPITT